MCRLPGGSFFVRSASVIVVAFGLGCVAKASPAPTPSATVSPRPAVPETLEGPLVINGGVASVGGYMIPRAELQGRFGNEWEASVQGRRLRVVGVKEEASCARCLRAITSIVRLCEDGREPLFPAPCPGNDLMEALHCPGRFCTGTTVWNGKKCVEACDPAR